jgi:hypothetical protein
MKARESEDEYNQATIESNRILEKREAELRELDRKLREKESNSSEAEKGQLLAQRMEVMLLLYQGLANPYQERLYISADLLSPLSLEFVPCCSSLCYSDEAYCSSQP